MLSRDFVLRAYRFHFAQFVFFRFARAFVLFLLRHIRFLVSRLRHSPYSKSYKWHTFSKSRDSCVFFSTFYPREEFISPAPVFIGYHACEAAARTPQRNLVLPAVQVLELKSALVVGGVDAIFHQNRALHHDLFDPESHLSPAENVGLVSVARGRKMVSLRLTRDAIETSRAVSLVGQCSANYAHWITEILPKLAIIDRIRRFDGFSLLIDDCLHPNILESISLIMKNRRDLISVPRWAPVVAESLVAISSPGYERYTPDSVASVEPSPYVNVFSRSAFHDFRLVVTEATGNCLIDQRTLVYFGRSNLSGNLRFVSNADRLESIALSRGFSVFRPESISFRAQVDACANAGVFVAPIGASVVNMIFAPPGCIVVVLAPYYNESNYFYYTNLAAILGHRIRFVLGRQVSTSRHPMHRNYCVDEGDFESALTRAVLDSGLGGALGA